MTPEMYCAAGWLALAVLLGIAEALTVGLVAIWFAIGALAAIIPAYMGAPFWVQFLVFLIVSAVCLAFTRKFFKGYLKVKKQSTNADSLVGQEGLCSQTINNIRETGKVDISGLTWTARTVDDSVISEGSVVVVDSITGVTLIVHKKFPD